MIFIVNINDIIRLDNLYIFLYLILGVFMEKIHEPVTG